MLWRAGSRGFVCPDPCLWTARTVMSRSSRPTSGALARKQQRHPEHPEVFSLIYPLTRDPDHLKHLASCPLVCRRTETKSVLPLEIRRQEYQRTMNGVYLIEACLLAHDDGLYFDPWAIDTLSKAFREW